ncbi:MAG: transposase [Patescibacteria group bacterium]|jgi:putative transposase|nr:transposase [Patescibacteria group bacterium]
MKRTKFQKGEYYHIYNRGVDKREIFLDKYDYLRFLLGIKEFNQLEPIGSIYLKQRNDFSHPMTKNEKLVDIIAYSLLPNHYHILVKELVENGLSKFMHKVSMGYSRFINEKYKRSGSLFQGSYKLVHIDSENYINYISAYINGNPEIHGIGKAEKYIWSSYKEYLGERDGIIPKKEDVLKNFSSKKDYSDYVKKVVVNAKQRKEDVKKYLLE